MLGAIHLLKNTIYNDCGKIAKILKTCIGKFVQIQMKIKIYVVIMSGCLPFMSPQHPSHCTTHSNKSTIGTCDPPATSRSRQIIPRRNGTEASEAQRRPTSEHQYKVDEILEKKDGSLLGSIVICGGCFYAEQPGTWWNRRKAGKNARNSGRRKK